jgi:nitroimidazol reductase NimA-like FMN-containing flavoprotein (pyridoxamine 5'-phosphate oxidase superfamily)
MRYTGQAPVLTDEEIETVLKENRRAIVCTHNKDGTIHAVPVDYRYINGRILIVSFGPSRKNRNIKRNKNVTVLVSKENPFRGIMIYGEAELEYDNVVSKAVIVLETSGYSREKIEHFVEALLEKVKCVIINVKPKHMVSFDYTKDNVYNDLIKKHLLK